jgi:hypothetical protein
MNRTWQLTPSVIVGFLLVILYVGFYLANPATPGNRFDPCCITGWIGWWDQGRYYDSTRALAAGNLDPGQHWYPLGYAILAVPFHFLGNHPFFPVDLISLLVAYTAFILFAVRVGVSASIAAAIFLLTSCLDSILFEQWAIPWNTSPSAALIWTLLAVGAAHLQGGRRPFLLGILAGALPAIRPTDAILGAICLAWLAVADLRASRLTMRACALAAAGAAVPVLLYGALYLEIYGLHPTAYMLNSQNIGFTIHNPIWRAYVLLIEPRQWFFAGQGLLNRIPWLIFGFAGALWAWRRAGALALLSACLTAYCLLFLCYVDLLPTGLWRYLNIHYFKWTLPGFGLLAWLLLGELRLRGQTAWGALAIVLLLSCIRVTPRPASADEPAAAVDLMGIAATEGNTTMNPELIAIDTSGAAPNITTMRAFPLPDGDGARLIGLRRDFSGPVVWAPDHGLSQKAGAPQFRWAEAIGFGYPCWLPPYPCKKPVR